MGDEDDDVDEFIVKEVTLLEGNAEYAHIEHPDGRESTVSTRHLAPMRKDKEETLPDSTMTDAELSEPQDKITSQEKDGSILNEEVTLLEGNAEYAHIKHPDGRESTVSTRHLAPMRKDKEETLPDSTMTGAELSESQDKITSQEKDGSILDGTINESIEGNRTNLINQTTDSRNSPFIRRSSKLRRTPAYLEDYEHH
ncbi:hypothetical protein HHI36_000361 [Cryptolaemus montrouzieri]|uniref:Uncharacterized protein n=1 Tax=Cryptolaemus montrouzieri TaxID=559131 RepID=A0ABD2P4F6_9CUCU